MVTLSFLPQQAKETFSQGMRALKKRPLLCTSLALGGAATVASYLYSKELVSLTTQNLESFSESSFGQAIDLKEKLYDWNLLERPPAVEEETYLETARQIISCLQTGFIASLPYLKGSLKLAYKAFNTLPLIFNNKTAVPTGLFLARYLAKHY